MALRFLPLLILLHVMTGAAPCLAGGDGELGPSEAEIRQARRLAATLRGADGIERALRIASRDESAIDVASNVASVVLVQRAVAAMPRLLAALAASDEPAFAAHADRGDTTWRRFVSAQRIATAAVCRGAEVDYYDVDERSPAAVERNRDAAQRAVIAALGKPGARRRGALEVLFAARPADRDWSGCGDAGRELVRDAAPALAKMLVAKDQEAGVLRLFAFGDADPSIAAPVVRPYLGHPTHLVVAALALARMGEDVSSAVAPIAQRLDGAEVDDALDALRAIGAGARGALPQLAALSKRLDATCERPVKAERLVSTVAAIATRPADAGAALPMLVPLIAKCPSALGGTAEAIAQLGDPGRAVLLTHLRDDNNSSWSRSVVAHALEKARVALDAADRDIVRLLAARQRSGDDGSSASQVVAEPPPPDPFKELAQAMTTCRAEARQRPVAATGVTADQAGQLASCFGNYLCGPSQRTLVRTLDRCCALVLGAQKPAFCRP